MKNFEFKKEEYVPLGPKDKIEVENVPTRNTRGVHGMVLEHMRKNELDKRYLNAEINLPEDLLIVIYKLDDLQREKENIEKQIENMPKEEENLNEAEDSPLFHLKRELGELEERISDMGDRIDEIVGENQDLHNKYNEFENIKNSRRALLNPDNYKNN